MYCSYTAFVDKKYGDDTTGMVEVSCRPFATIPAAVQAINVARLSNPGEGWVLKISPGQYGPISLNNAFAIDFQGSGLYTKFGKTILNACKYGCRFFDLSIQGLTAQATPKVTMLGASALSSASSALTLTDSDVVFDGVQIVDTAQGASPSIWSESSLISFSSGLIATRSDVAVPVVLFTGPSNPSQSSAFSSTTFAIETLQSSAVLLNETDSAAILFDNNTMNIQSSFGESSVFLSTGGAASSITASNTLVTGGTETNLLQEVSGGLAIARNQGDGKIAVSSTRLEFTQTTEVSQNTGGGDTTVQLTARGSSIAPPTVGVFVNENTNDRSKSLWMEGGLSLGVLYTQTDAVVGNDVYLCYCEPLSVDINIFIPPSEERIGRQLALSISASSLVFGKKAYVRPPVGDLIKFGTETFTDANPLVLGFGGIGEYVNVKLYAVKPDAAPVFWIMTL